MSLCFGVGWPDANGLGIISNEIISKIV